MRHLILACSATKTHHPDAIPALVRYDGPAWRVLRHYLTAGDHACYERLKHDLDITVISAKYGMFDAFTPIHDYNHPMDADRAAWIMHHQVGYADVHVRAARAHADGGYHHTLIAGGRLYRTIGHDLIHDDPAAFGHVQATYGGIGTQLGQLKQWLHDTQIVS